VPSAHATEARERFATQVAQLTHVNVETSIVINRVIDITRATICLATEDHSLVS
jgi:hypothetical protein